jgi:2-polyprenyl-3-methyl-5-hydroxy-6-metoxy-1,4-benzoquinol methylase
MNWAQPDVQQAAARLRFVFENREKARATDAEAGLNLRHRYAPEAVGQQAKSRLLYLLQRTNPTRWRQIQAAQRSRPDSPPVPIPGDWFDEQYFELGIKSNWDEGYQWPRFEALFRDTASFLGEIFPGVRSFLDAGCAKGFLVKALREKGYDAHGFDFSPWAINHAEPAARPWLTLAGADQYTPEAPCDVLLAFHLLAHLSEQQAADFLKRARAWTRVGVLAVTPLWESVTTDKADDRDLSHITRRPRAWWHQLFLNAGWRQDAMHRILEQTCQRHPLPARMGWQVFLYSPGD